MTKSKDHKDKTKITDWIQALAALISIPAAIFAFFTFFQKDKDLQRQIANLDTISRQSIIQTKILADQVKILNEERDFQIKQNDLSLSHRKTEIEPKLIIEFDNYNGDIISANLINNGKSAKIIQIKEKKNNGFLIDIPFQYIGEGKEKQIYFRFKNPDVQENTVLDFTLIYEDIDKKILSKDFHFSDIHKIIENRYKNIIL